MRNPGSEKQVSIHEYGSEEISQTYLVLEDKCKGRSLPDFSFSVEMNDKNTNYKSLMRNPGSE